MVCRSPSSPEISARRDKPPASTDDREAALVSVHVTHGSELARPDENSCVFSWVFDTAVHAHEPGIAEGAALFGRPCAVWNTGTERRPEDVHQMQLVELRLRNRGVEPACDTGSKAFRVHAIGILREEARPLLILRQAPVPVAERMGLPTGWGEVGEEVRHLAVEWPVQEAEAGVALDGEEERQVPLRVAAAVERALRPSPVSSAEMREERPVDIQRALEPVLDLLGVRVAVQYQGRLSQVGRDAAAVIVTRVVEEVPLDKKPPDLPCIGRQRHLDVRVLLGRVEVVGPVVHSKQTPGIAQADLVAPRAVDRAGPFRIPVDDLQEAGSGVIRRGRVAE